MLAVLAVLLMFVVLPVPLVLLVLLVLVVLLVLLRTDPRHPPLEGDHARQKFGAAGSTKSSARATTGRRSALEMHDRGAGLIFPHYICVIVCFAILS